MKQKLILTTILLVGAMAMLCGCVSYSQQAEKVFPGPEPGKGLVYFFRNYQMRCAPVVYLVKEGQTVLSPMKNRAYFFVQAEPGTHEYMVEQQTDSAITLTVEAGKTYYVAFKVEPTLQSAFSGLAGRPTMRVCTANEAASVLPSLDYVTK